MRMHNHVMKTPDIRNHKPTHEYFSELRSRLPATVRVISLNTGIHYRRLVYLAAGERPDGKGGRSPVVMTYAEQYLLETLADMPFENWAVQD